MYILRVLDCKTHVWEIQKNINTHNIVRVFLEVCALALTTQTSVGDTSNDWARYHLTRPSIYQDPKYKYQLTRPQIKISHIQDPKFKYQPTRPQIWISTRPKIWISHNKTPNIPRPQITTIYIYTHIQPSWLEFVI